jgi:hypothetical protein
LYNADVTHGARYTSHARVSVQSEREKMKQQSKKKSADRFSVFKDGERFATKALIVIAIATAIFILAQYVSFLVTRVEQTALIEYYFNAVVIECGALMLKRVTEVIVGKVKKKENIETESEETNNEY